MKRLLLMLACFIIVFSFAACGQIGPQGEKGDQGVPGRDGKDGVTPTITISEDGYWVINGEKTEYKAIGSDGKDGIDAITPIIKRKGGEFWVSYDGGETWELIEDVNDDIDDIPGEEETEDEVVTEASLNDILILEGKEGEGARLAELLYEKFDVTVLSFDDDIETIPSALPELCEYEEIILVNVAYSDMPAGFEEMLNTYVYELGGGLFTVGGSLNDDGTPHAYNRNDIAASKYFKQMLPVNAIDYTPPIAVVIVVDASASMSMGKLDAAKEGAEACLDALDDKDWCGVVSFDTRASEDLSIRPVTEREVIRDSIKKVGSDGASGGTIFSSAIMTAGNALSVIDNVERKHIILVTDGNPGDRLEEYQKYIEDNLAKGITMSIVTINNEDSSLREQMSEAANVGGGFYYNILTSDMQKIVNETQKDIAFINFPEIPYGESFTVTVKDESFATEGVDNAFLPNLSGFYSTKEKDGASVVLVGNYFPIYAEWQYGIGNVGSFMCDLSGIWSDEFMNDVVGQNIIMNIVSSLKASERLM